MNKQIRVGDSKNVIVFDPLLTGHVIRRMRSGSVRIINGNQWETLSLITQERIGVGASTLVGIIDVGVDTCGIYARPVLYPYGSRPTKLAGTRTGTVRDGLSRLGPVWIPRTETAGYPPGIPYGPREV